MSKIFYLRFIANSIFFGYLNDNCFFLILQIQGEFLILRFLKC